MTCWLVVECLNSTAPLHPPLRLTQKFILNFSPPSNHMSAGSHEIHVFVSCTSCIHPVPSNLHNLTYQYNNTKSRVQIITSIYNFPNSRLWSPLFGQNILQGIFFKYIIREHEYVFTYGTTSNLSMCKLHVEAK